MDFPVLFHISGKNITVYLLFEAVRRLPGKRYYFYFLPQVIGHKSQLRRVNLHHLLNMQDLKNKKREIKFHAFFIFK
ncbi:hypothetical protein EG344_11430 [Chryseobacterium sp. G0162]|nr:hypothetical protein EG344_11430 [Chryseobacterium sp. G0162]